MRQKRAVKRLIALLPALLLAATACAQPFGLRQQFGGRSDFTFLGNTLNYVENEGNPPGTCTIMTSSSANLALGPGDNVVFARIYWAGTGDGTGDDVVQLNGQEVVADTILTFSYSGLKSFNATADVTALVQETGAGNYTFSGLDLNDVINSSIYCQSGLNFGGWAITVVYENPALPINQINVYDGLRGVPSALTIQLNSLDVIDSEDAKIGFIAWEGDSALANNETLTFNNVVLSNPLNPPTNAFNGTNSVTGSSELYNMDIDIYDIEGIIQPGQTQATIKLTSNADLVMISTVVTKLNSELPDATVTIDTAETSCGSREFTIGYTVGNFESTDVLPAGTPVSIYAGDVYITTVLTTASLQPDESESGLVTFFLPNEVSDDFTLEFRADRFQDGSELSVELSETNNITTMDLSLLEIPSFTTPEGLLACNLGNKLGRFDFSGYADTVATDGTDAVTFHASEETAIAGTLPILDSSAYEAITPATVWVRITDAYDCFAVTSFGLETYNCPPVVYNLVEPGDNGYFDFMQSTGLHDIFLEYKMSIYNRWGALVWTGFNEQEDFNGRANEGNGWIGADLPGGTYFYILELNDPDYPDPMTGFLYLKK